MFGQRNAWTLRGPVMSVPKINHCVYHGKELALLSVVCTVESQLEDLTNSEPLSKFVP